jgi:hypothetical protein
MEKFFVAATKSARESAENAKEIDGFVRKYYSHEPRKMAQWEEIMSKYEFMDDEIADQE